MASKKQCCQTYIFWSWWPKFSLFSSQPLQDSCKINTERSDLTCSNDPYTNVPVKTCMDHSPVHNSSLVPASGCLPLLYVAGVLDVHLHFSAGPDSWPFPDFWIYLLVQNRHCCILHQRNCQAHWSSLPLTPLYCRISLASWKVLQNYITFELDISQTCAKCNNMYLMIILY